MHSLPVGYVLQREKKEAERLAKEMEDDEDEKTLEEIIEEERAKLPNEGLTKVTKDSFFEWKKRKAEQKKKDLEQKMKEESKKTGGKGTNILSGKALFTYDPSLFKDDENAADDQVYEERNDEELEKIEEEKKEEDGYENGTTDNQGENGEEEEHEMIKKQGVDTNLFSQEEVGDNEEEPDFD